MLLVMQICKDKDEAEVWFVGLRALVSRGTCRKWRTDSIRSERFSSDTNSTTTSTQTSSPPLRADLLLKVDIFNVTWVLKFFLVK